MPKVIKNTVKNDYVKTFEGEVVFTEELLEAFDFSNEPEVLPPALKQSEALLIQLNEPEANVFIIEELK